MLQDKLKHYTSNSEQAQILIQMHLGKKNSDIMRIGGLHRKGSGYCQSKLPRVKNTHAEETYFMSKKACFGDIRDQIFIIKKSPGAQ